MIEKLVLALLKRLGTKKVIARVAEALAGYLKEHDVELLEELLIKIGENLSSHTESNADYKLVRYMKNSLKKKGKK